MRSWNDREILICSWPTVDFEYDEVNNDRKRARDNAFLQIVDPPASCNSPSMIFKPELFEAQTTHQAGCESVKTWQNSNAALPIVLFIFYHIPEV